MRLVAVAVASLLIGGASGAAVVALADDGPDRVRIVDTDGPGGRFDGRFGQGPFRNGADAN